MNFMYMYMKHRESGQAMIEFVLVFPVFIALICMIIDCGWIGYQYILFDYAYREASWELKIPIENRMYTEPVYVSNPEDYIRNGILKHGSGDALIDSSNLQVNNAEINLIPGAYKDVNPAENYGEYEEVHYKTINMFIIADLNYSVDIITPLGQHIFRKTNIDIKKHVYKERLLSVKTV